MEGLGRFRGGRGGRESTADFQEGQRGGDHDCGARAESNSVGERESTGYLRGWEGVGSFFWKNLKFSLDSCTGLCYNKQRI